MINVHPLIRTPPRERLPDARRACASAEIHMTSPSPLQNYDCHNIDSIALRRINDRTVRRENSRQDKQKRGRRFSNDRLKLVLITKILERRTNSRSLSRLLLRTSHNFAIKKKYLQVFVAGLNDSLSQKDSRICNSPFPQSMLAT